VLSVCAGWLVRGGGGGGGWWGGGGGSGLEAATVTAAPRLQHTLEPAPRCHRAHCSSNTRAQHTHHALQFDSPQVFNDERHGLNVYGSNVEVDYRGAEVTVENFMRVLTGGSNKAWWRLAGWLAGAWETGAAAGPFACTTDTTEHAAERRLEARARSPGRLSPSGPVCVCGHCCCCRVRPPRPTGRHNPAVPRPKRMLSDRGSNVLVRGRVVRAVRFSAAWAAAAHRQALGISARARGAHWRACCVPCCAVMCGVLASLRHCRVPTHTTHPHATHTHTHHPATCLPRCTSQATAATSS
jgi:hypothetical protein